MYPAVLWEKRMPQRESPAIERGRTDAVRAGIEAAVFWTNNKTTWLNIWR